MKNTFFKNPIILIGLLLFLALVFATLYRVTLAFDTHPELVNADAYNVGTQYSKHLENTKHLKQAGYKLEVSKEPYLRQNTAHTYEASFSKDNIVLDTAVITAQFYRQLEPAYDFSATFDKNILITKLPRKGKWLLVITAEYEDKAMYKFRNLYVNELIE